MTYPETIAGCCRELLDASSEPVSLTDLAAHAAALERTRARYPELSVSSTLRDNPHVLAVEGDRFLSVRRLLEGRVLTTRDPVVVDPYGVGLGGFDFSPFRSLSPPDEQVLDDGALVGYRCRDGRLVPEPVDAAELADATALTNAVRSGLGSRYPSRLEIGREVLLACIADDALLRRPVPPLSELFADLIPKPPAPPQRRCSACEGTGGRPEWWEPDWPPYDYGRDRSDSRFGSRLEDEPPYNARPRDWSERIELLEQAVFGT